MRILPMGSRAVLVEDPPGDPARWSVGLRNLDIHGVTEVVPAARTVLITCATAGALASVVAQIEDVRPASDGGAAAEPVVIPTAYDGPDLAEVAAEIGRSIDDVIELHSAAMYRVAFCGFAPGFAYLSGLPPELHLPRRSTPRQRVPLGSVAIAAEYSAVYPGASPGGWHLLGRTERPMFEVDADPPVVLVPGATVRFEPR